MKPLLDIMPRYVRGVSRISSGDVAIVCVPSELDALKRWMCRDMQGPMPVPEGVPCGRTRWTAAATTLYPSSGKGAR